MGERLAQAATDGLVLGVKYAVALICLGLALLWLAGDYSVTRARAQNGQVAFEYLQQQQAKQAAPK